MSREGIEFDYQLDVRFGDLDAYGHLNSMNYLDLVSTSRLLYMERERGMSTAELIKRGYGFYLTKVTQEFLKPVPGMVQIRVVSRVANHEGARFQVTYEMKDPELKVTYSKGCFEVVVIDLKNNRPALPPDWMYDLFLKPAASS